MFNRIALSIYTGGGLAGIAALLSALKSRSTYYENEDGATVILEQFKNCTS